MAFQKHQNNDQNTRFNRYIVECKCGDAGTGKTTWARFNRYIVECKLRSVMPVVICSIGFNRYIVECKLHE